MNTKYTSEQKEKEKKIRIFLIEDYSFRIEQIFYRFYSFFPPPVYSFFLIFYWFFVLFLLFIIKRIF
jgi:hypothetical protein